MKEEQNEETKVSITEKGEYIVYQIRERKKLTKQRNALVFVIVIISITFVIAYFNK